jgi:hypothetical protein
MCQHPDRGGGFTLVQSIFGVHVVKTRSAFSLTQNKSEKMRMKKNKKNEKK